MAAAGRRRSAEPLDAALDRIAPKSALLCELDTYAPPTIKGAARASTGLRTDMFLSCTASTVLRRTAPCAAGEAKQWPARKLSARGSVCRDRRFRGATRRKRALRRPAVRLAATNGVARRDVFFVA